MCTRSLLTALLTVASAHVRSQSNPAWQWMHPQPNSNPLSALHFFDADNGLATGSGDLGFLMRTSDGGATWHRVEGGLNDPGRPCTGLVATDANTLFAVTGRDYFGASVGDYFQRSLDRGATWQTFSRLVDYSLRRGPCAFADSTTWVIFDPLHGTPTQPYLCWCWTSNAGNTWIVDSIPATDGTVRAVTFIDARTAIAVGGGIDRTTDAGRHWVEVSYTPPTAMTCVAFPTATTGCAAGLSKEIIRTTDGGTTWTTVNTGSYADLRAIAFVDANTGVAVGGNDVNVSNAALRTTDGGQTWTSLYPGLTHPFLSVQFVDHTTGFAGGAAGDLWKSTNAGASWNALDTTGRAWFTRVAFPTRDTGYALGTYGYSDVRLLRTVDGGRTWRLVWRPYQSLSMIVKDVAALSGSRLVATGNPNSGEHGRVWVSSDAGFTWTETLTSTLVAGMAFPSATTGYAEFSGGRTFKSSDGGGSWTQLPHDTSAAAATLAFFDDLTGYKSYGFGTVHKTTDGGQTWATVHTGSIGDLYVFYAFRDALHGIAGGGGDITRTTDGGATWESVYIEGLGDIQRVAYADSGCFLVTGHSNSDGRVYRSTNDGLTWIDLGAPTANGCYDFAFADPRTLFVVGWGGTILRYGSPLIDVREPAVVPAGVRLSEAYPDPLTTSADVEVELSTARRIDLTLVDALGREVLFIASGASPQGTTRYHVDAGGLPCGVYVLRLRAASTVLQRRVLVVR